MRLDPKNATPWVTKKALAFMLEVSRGNVFEWGSGSSTVFFAVRCSRVESIENDPEWHRKVLDALRIHNLTNVNLRLIPHDNGIAGGDGSIPGRFFSNSAHYGNRRFERYSKAIDDHSRDSFDLVVVDGRARASCLVRAVEKVKPGGVLVLDDASRPYYQKGIAIVDGMGWLKTRFEGGHGKMPLIAWRKP